MATVTPWWKTMRLRDEIATAAGSIEDVQMSLYNAVHGVAGRTFPYSDAGYYGEITHPAESLVDLMSQIAVRLGASGYEHARALWRLDQGMGGGKSHGLIGLWHLVEHTEQFAKTELGRLVLAESERIVGKDGLDPLLGKPRCVVLSCDNLTPGKGDKLLDGPAETLGERFLWRLFDGASKKWNEYREHTTAKAKLAEAIHDVGRPVLILVDEIMDYIRAAAAEDQHLVMRDMAFLNALLDVVNDVPNCAMVAVMIASGRTLAGDEVTDRCRAELEELLVRNGETTAVTSSGDFAEIIRRRLFQGSPPDEVVDRTVELFVTGMRGAWEKDVFSKLGTLSSGDFAGKVRRSYPFHPSLIELAEHEWSLNTGFQRVRSTIQVFAATVHAQEQRAAASEWVPLLIGTGDLPLSARLVREAILNSGLIPDQRTVASFREIAGNEVADPDHADRGTAHQLDVRRVDTGWEAANPRAAERIATALFVYSVGPRPQGRQGAVEAELKAASFVPVNSYGPGDAEVVLAELRSPDGLAALDELPGKGGQPPRLVLTTRQTLNMLIRVHRSTVTDEERDAEVARLAFDRVPTGPFDAVVVVDAGGSPVSKPSVSDMLAVLEGAGIDDARKTRLVVLDPRWFTLLNGTDTDTRAAVRAAMGLGDNKLAVSWASSAVFACANTQRRNLAKGVATEYLASRRVASLDAIKADPELREQAQALLKEGEARLRKSVREAYQHILYLGEDSATGRTDATIRLHKENQTALDGSVVWAALDETGKAFGAGQFSAKALVHNLRSQDWGRPLSEIRDTFWNTPRVPLLHGGEAELRVALYDAVQAGEARLVGGDEKARAVTGPGDINLGTSGIRLVRPGTDDTAERVQVPDLIGRERPAARLALEKLGLLLEGAGDGVVASQDPEAGTPVGPGAIVILTFKQPAGNRPVAEHQVTISATKSLRDDDGARDSLRNLLNEIKNAVDNDASFIQMTVKLTAPTATKDAMVSKAEAAGLNSTVTDL